LSLGRGAPSIVAHAASHLTCYFLPQENVGSFLKARFQLYPYQLLRWFSELTGIELAVETKQALFKTVLFTFLIFIGFFLFLVISAAQITTPIVSENVISVDFTSERVLYHKFKDQVFARSNRALCFPHFLFSSVLLLTSFLSAAVLEAVNLEVAAERFKPTVEYSSLLSALGCKDAFREKNPTKVSCSCCDMLHHHFN